jgi:8-oxo-dGTP diphosphatase
MRARSSSSARAGRTPPAASVDLICCSAAAGRLVVLAPVVARGRRPELPWQALDPDTPLEPAAQRLARAAAGRAPTWMVQLGAFGGGQRHPAGAALSVAYAAIVPSGTAAPDGMSWQPVAALATLGPRQQAMLAAALAALRDRMDIAPIAFRMLPPTFTLSELQEMYELLLGRRLHKASFRRALQSSYLVEPTDEWRSEGRGRPAQLFRYAPRKRRGIRRSVRFELLG